MNKDRNEKALMVKDLNVRHAPQNGGLCVSAAGASHSKDGRWRCAAQRTTCASLHDVRLHNTAAVRRLGGCIYNCWIGIAEQTQ